MMHCSVIIPHFNQVAHLNQCLEALSLQKSEGINFEVIVVDNGTKSFESLSFPIKNLKFIPYSNSKNPYLCRNEGIKISKGKHLAFLDAKSVPSKKWLLKGLAMLESYDIVGGHYKVKTNSDLSSNVFPLMYLNNAKNAHQGYGFSAGNVFIKRKVFDAIGLFETQSVSGNDILFTRKAQHQGFTLGYAHAVVVSYPSKDFSKLKKDAKKYGKGAALTGQKSILSVLQYLMPMRIDTFKSAIVERDFHFSISQKITLWFYVWIAKTQFAQGLFNGILSRYRQQINPSPS